MALPRPTRALTLLELLLVIFLLSALAASAITLAGDADAQSRLELTRARRAQLRSAILGPEETVQGERVTRGFVADMGRLPRSIQELLRPFDESGDPLPLYEFNSNYQASAGWRGPYLAIDTRESTSNGRLPVFRDGWSTVKTLTVPAPSPSAPNPNFGWSVESTSTYFDAISLGRNGLDGGTATPDLGPDAELPYSPSDASIQPYERLVPPNTWSLDRLNGPVRELALTLHNLGSVAVVQSSVRARIAIPRVEAAGLSWEVDASWATTRDDRGDTSTLGPPSDIPPGGSIAVTFRFQPVSAGAQPYERLPAGRWPLVIVLDGSGARVGPVTPLSGAPYAPVLLAVDVSPGGGLTFPKVTDLWIDP